MRDNRKWLDYVITVPATIFCAPLLVGIAIWVKIDSPGPVFFRQKRVGIHQKYFEILKFRTMRADTPKDVPTHLLENPDQYIGVELEFPIVNTGSGQYDSMISPTCYKSG